MPWLMLMMFERSFLTRAVFLKGFSKVSANSSLHYRVLHGLCIYQRIEAHSGLQVRVFVQCQPDAFCCRLVRSLENVLDLHRQAVRCG